MFKVLLLTSSDLLIISNDDDDDDDDWWLIMFYSENQQFLKDLIRNVMRGDGIGWLNSKKLQRLMTDESLRQMVANRLYSAPSADRTTDIVDDTVSSCCYR